ncbi:MAG: class I SAM-dependent methyltransferase [Candidatus Heimdallarchaeota archaeon]|nr:MAG: class I SAM-dependent methyltransferase [Candidatus Heimdallarchaeota archaeon]
MSCPQCNGIETTFNHKSALKELKNYHKKGPNKSTRFLINYLVSKGIEDKTLLDIGGGVGAIQHELIKNGLASVVSVEASKAYSEASKDEAKHQGHADKINYFHGDFVDLSPEIPMTDVVTLDRVICCYVNMEKLVNSSLNHARDYYAVIYPHDKWWMKLGITVGNFLQWLKRSKYRGFIHSKKEFHRVVEAHNFKRCFFQKTMFWRIEIFQRMQKINDQPNS